MKSKGRWRQCTAISRC